MKFSIMTVLALSALALMMNALSDDYEIQYARRGDNKDDD